MDDDNWRAMALMGFVVSNTTVLKMYQKGKITSREAADIYDEALLNLETNQALAGDATSVVLLARSMIEQMLEEVRNAPD